MKFDSVSRVYTKILYLPRKLVWTLLTMHLCPISFQHTETPQPKKAWASQRKVVDVQSKKKGSMKIIKTLEILSERIILDLWWWGTNWRRNINKEYWRGLHSHIWWHYFGSFYTDNWIHFHEIRNRKGHWYKTYGIQGRKHKKGTKVLILYYIIFLK